MSNDGEESEFPSLETLAKCGKRIYHYDYVWRGKTYILEQYRLDNSVYTVQNCAVLGRIDYQKRE